MKLVTNIMVWTQNKDETKKITTNLKMKTSRLEHRKLYM